VVVHAAIGAAGAAHCHAIGCGAVRGCLGPRGHERVICLRPPPTPWDCDGAGLSGRYQPRGIATALVHSGPGLGFLSRIGKHTA
jgi:hypothetical protein